MREEDPEAMRSRRPSRAIIDNEQNQNQSSPVKSSRDDSHGLYGGSAVQCSGMRKYRLAGDCTSRSNRTDAS